MLKKNFSQIKFCICSKSQKKKNIGAIEWYRDYNDALKKSNADIVFIAAFVAQNMNAGVSIFPWGVFKTPVLARENDEFFKIVQLNFDIKIIFLQEI